MMVKEFFHYLNGTINCGNDYAIAALGLGLMEQKRKQTLKIHQTFSSQKTSVTASILFSDKYKVNLSST